MFTNNLITKVYKAFQLSEMTDLEFWTFMCIVSVFLSLLSYGVILIKDQMIIQVLIIIIILNILLTLITLIALINKSF